MSTERPIITEYWSNGGVIEAERTADNVRLYVADAGGSALITVPIAELQTMMAALGIRVLAGVEATR